MTTQAQLLSLVKSYSQRDDARFHSVALGLAAEADRRGNRRVAEEIRELIQGQQRALPVDVTRGPIPVVRPRGELAGLISAGYPMTRLDDMVLAPATDTKLNRFVEEQRNKTKLGAHGLLPRRKLLLVGPPGTGKTMSASALAGMLSLPLFTILLDGVITKFMGETAAKLRLVFEAMRATRGVYFFDEFDALASARLMENDVGEARRMLNSVLQLMDEDTSEAVIVAATNHRALLDPALFRRFDSVIEYSILPQGAVRRVFEIALFAFSLEEIDWAEVARHASGLSQSDMVRAAGDAARAAVLEHEARLDTGLLVDAIDEYSRLPERGAEPLPA